MTTLRRFAVLTLALLAVLATVTSAWAQAGPAAPALDAARRPPPPPPGYPVLPGIWRLHGNDPLLPMDDDLEPLRKLVGKAQVVALGESIHTSGGYYRMKHRVFRFLVEEMGFRVFAFESPWPDADRVAAYVQTCAGTPEEALSGLFGVWQSTETRDLVQWMCEWNRTHRKPKDRLHFFGFDVQQPDQDGPALLAYLERTGVASDNPWVAGVQACDGVGAPFADAGEVPLESHAQCTQALQEIDAHFRQNARTLQSRTSKKDFELAKLYLVGLRAWQDAAFYLLIDDTRSYSARDVGMAYAFQALRALRFPKAKVVVWAHNSHIARGALLTGELPMGSHLAAALGSSYVNFALAAHEAEIDWPAAGCGRAARPTAGSVEEPLHDLGEQALLVDLRFPGTSDPYLPPGAYSIGTRRVVPHDLYTGILYLDHSPKMTPISWPSCQ